MRKSLQEIHGILQTTRAQACLASVVGHVGTCWNTLNIPSLPNHRDFFGPVAFFPPGTQLNSSIGILIVCCKACSCTRVIWEASLVQKGLQSNSQSFKGRRFMFFLMFFSLILLGSRTRQPIGLEPAKRQQHGLISQPQTTRHTMKIIEEITPEVLSKQYKAISHHRHCERTE